MQKEICPLEVIKFRVLVTMTKLQSVQCDNL